MGRLGVGTGVGGTVGSVGVTTGRLGVGTGKVGSGVPDPVGVGEGPDPLAVGLGEGLGPGRSELAWSREASAVISGDSGESRCGLSAR